MTLDGLTHCQMLFIKSKMVMLILAFVVMLSVTFLGLCSCSHTNGFSLLKGSDQSVKNFTFFLFFLKVFPIHKSFFTIFRKYCAHMDIAK